MNQVLLTVTEIEAMIRLIRPNIADFNRCIAKLDIGPGFEQPIRDTLITARDEAEIALLLLKNLCDIAIERDKRFGGDRE